MVLESSAEKQKPKISKENDLFGFLMEPVVKVKEAESNSLNTVDNWGEAFGLVTTRQAPLKAEEQPLTQALESPKRN